MKLLKLFPLLALLCSCATNQKSRLTATGIGIGVGAIAGAATAPKDERKELHALYWGGIVGSLAAIAANYYFDDEKDISYIKLENEKLKAQMDFFQSGQPAKLLKDLKGASKEKTEYQKGNIKIRLFQVDSWADDGPDKKYHRDLLMETSTIDK